MLPFYLNHFLWLLALCMVFPVFTQIFDFGFNYKTLLLHQIKAQVREICQTRCCTNFCKKINPVYISLNILTNDVANSSNVYRIISLYKLLADLSRCFEQPKRKSSVFNSRIKATTTDVRESLVKPLCIIQELLPSTLPGVILIAI